MKVKFTYQSGNGQVWKCKHCHHWIRKWWDTQLPRLWSQSGARTEAGSHTRAPLPLSCFISSRNVLALWSHKRQGTHCLFCCPHTDSRGMNRDYCCTEMSRFTSNPSAAAGNVMVTLPLPQLQVRTRYPKSWMIISASPSSGLEMFRSVIWELEWDYWAHFIPKQYCSSLPLTLTKTLLSYLGIGSAVADFFNKDMRQNYNLESTLCLQKWKIWNLVIITFVVWHGEGGVLWRLVPILPDASF